jgi:hypothetical protein
MKPGMENPNPLSDFQNFRSCFCIMLWLLFIKITFFKLSSELFCFDEMYIVNLI